MSDQFEHFHKKREIAFCSLHSDPNQAGTAAALLLAADGIEQVEVITPNLLRVHYHLLNIQLTDIEKIIEDEGLHLDNSLVYKIRRALYHYAEDTQRANCGCTSDASDNTTQKVFINRYQRRNHGCQDDRSEHWRKYR